MISRTFAKHVRCRLYTPAVENETRHKGGLTESSAIVAAIYKSFYVHTARVKNTRA